MDFPVTEDALLPIGISFSVRHFVSWTICGCYWNYKRKRVSGDR